MKGWFKKLPNVGVLQGGLPSPVIWWNICTAFEGYHPDVTPVKPIDFRPLNSGLKNITPLKKLVGGPPRVASPNATKLEKTQALQKVTFCLKEVNLKNLILRNPPALPAGFRVELGLCGWSCMDVSRGPPVTSPFKPSQRVIFAFFVTFFGMVKTWPFWLRWLSDLQRLGMKRSRIESPGTFTMNLSELYVGKYFGPCLHTGKPNGKREG